MNEYAEYERDVLAEITADERRSHPVHSALKLARFVSTSNGRGRAPRKPREVALVVRLRGGATAWNTTEFDLLHEEIDGEYLGSETDLIDALLDGESWPE